MKKSGHSTWQFLLFSLLLCGILLFFCTILTFIQGDKPTSVIKEDTAITVILDAGHGGEDGGASGQSGVLEKDLNLDIALTVGAYLEQSGIRVIYTRTEDILLYDKNTNYHGRKKVLDLAARLKIANQTENSIFVSIHMNSFPIEKYKGLQVYYAKKEEKSQILAQMIQNNAKNLIDADNDRKVKAATSAIYLLDRAEHPAVLIECGFLSNAEDLARLSSPEYRTALSLVIAHSIAEYLADVS